VDIVPTILEACGLEMPKVYRGVEQWPLSGVSMKYSFDAKPDGSTQKKRQYYAMLGTRGYWEDGWKIVATHAANTDKGHFDTDPWELYHVDVDRSESKNLAKENPDKLNALIKGWYEEADRNLVLPLDDRSPAVILGVPRPSEEPARDRYTYYPDSAPVPEGVAVSVRGRSYKILANVELTDPNASGVLFAHGSRFGGHTLFIMEKKLHYVYNFLGITEQVFVSSDGLKPGKYILGMEFIREGEGPHKENVGKMKLYINDKVAAEGAMKTQLGKFTLSGDGLCVGYDSADAVSKEYDAPDRFKGGTIQFVEVAVDKAQYVDRETELRRALRD
jgi:arylsulfatase